MNGFLTSNASRSMALQQLVENYHGKKIKNELQKNYSVINQHHGVNI